MKKLMWLFAMVAVTLYALPLFAQDQTVTKTTWGALKVRYRGESNQPQEVGTSRAIAKPGAEMNATAPYFPGWQVVRPYSIELIGPWYDRDWKITFYIPNRSTKPSYIDVAAFTNSKGWLVYDQYLDEYGPGPYGSAYKISYIFGWGKSVAFGIDMRPENWALYYR